MLAGTLIMIAGLTWGAGRLNKNEPTKSVSDLYAPVTGTVTARNEALDGQPELVNSDPYGEGWMYELTVADAGVLEGLMDVDAYTAQLS